MTERLSSDIAENLKRIRARIEAAAASVGRRPEDVALMAVTKAVPADIVNLAVAQGVALLGENRAQELLAKYGQYNRDCLSIHFIGHLQTNKVRQIADKVTMVHSVDSGRLAAEIDRQARRLGKIMDVLIEVNVGGEQSKSGADPAQLRELSSEIGEYAHIRLRGLMAIPPICDTEQQSERYFSKMEQFFIDMKRENRDNRNVDILSMGMSADYPAAIRHGATIVRLGTALFGSGRSV